MTKVILLIVMLFAHIVDDYYLQGILASMKQKKWWEENAPDELYKHDYMVALIEHAFSWAVMVHIPAVLYAFYTGNVPPGILCAVLFVVTWAIHALTDNAKANEHEINLVEDQLIHFIQVVGVWLVYVVEGR